MTLLRRRRDERGLSESVQWAALTPLVLLLTLGSIQAGVWLHARNVAHEAAAAGAELACVADPGQGARAAALSVAAQGGLMDPGVTIARGGGWVVVTVTGRAPLVFDIGAGRVRQVVQMPVERVSDP